MLKTIGLLTVFVCSSFAGVRLSYREEVKRTACNELLMFFSYLSKEITRKRRINDIITEATCRNRYLKASGKAELICLINNFYENDGTSEIAQKSCEFLEALGKSPSAEAEYYSCKSLIEAIKPICDKFCSDSKKRSQLSSSLGVVFGLALCILII